MLNHSYFSDDVKHAKHISHCGQSQDKYRMFECSLFIIPLLCTKYKHIQMRSNTERNVQQAVVCVR